MAKRVKHLPINQVSVELYNQWTAHKLDLFRVEESHRRQVFDMLTGVQKDISHRLDVDYKVYQTTNKRKLSEWRQARLAKIHDSVSVTLNDYGKKVEKWHRCELVDLLQAEFEFSADAFNSAIGANILTVTPALAQVKAMASDLMIQGAPSKEWWAGHTDDIQKKFMRTVRTGMYQGEGIDAIRRRVFDDPELLKTIAKTDEAIISKPMFRTVKRNAEALVRTSVQTASAAARDQLYSDNADIFNGEEHVSTLDGRTTPHCGAYDSKQWDMDGVPIGHDLVLIRPPSYHFGCRSWMAPVTKSWEELAGVKVKSRGGEQTVRDKFEASLRKRGLSEDEISKAIMGARSSCAPDYTGPVSDRSFDSWLKKRPADFQREYLGKGKYELWQKNKLSMRDLVDSRGNELTVAQLRDKIAGERLQKIPSL